MTIPNILMPAGTMVKMPAPALEKPVAMRMQTTVKKTPNMVHVIHADLAIQFLDFILDGDDFEALRHLASVLGDLGDFFGEDGAICSLYLQAAVAELTGHKTGGA